MSRHHRHSRAHTRHHFIRVARKRRQKFVQLEPDFANGSIAPDLSLGRFDNEHPYLGCHRPRCGVCHPTKRWHRGADRAAAEREWRRVEARELKSSLW